MSVDSIFSSIEYDNLLRAAAVSCFLGFLLEFIKLRKHQCVMKSQFENYHETI